MNMRLDYRISCLLSIFRREFDEAGPAAAAAAGATLVSTSGAGNETPKLAVDKRIDLESISFKAESIFDNVTSSCNITDGAEYEESAAVDLDLDGQGGIKLLEEAINHLNLKLECGLYSYRS